MLSYRTLRNCFSAVPGSVRRNFRAVCLSKRWYHTSMCWSSRKMTPVEKHKKLAEKIYYAAVESVKPSNIVRSKVKRDGRILTISVSGETATIDLDEYNKCYVIGFGKAVLPMAEETVDILGSRVERCIVSVPDGTRDSSKSVIEMYRGAKNNLPDANAALAAQKIIQLVESCNENDLLFVLISGGGSALLPAPVPPVTLEEKTLIIKLLSAAGADINELNIVRKRISSTKGGGLVKRCKSKKIVSLILSDVLGDPLDAIASGPTVFNPDDEGDAWKVVLKYVPNLKAVPESIQKILQEKENLDRRKEIFSVCQNFIIGNNKVALKAAFDTASRSSDFAPFILTANLTGVAKQIGISLATLSVAFANEQTVSVDKVLPIFRELRLSGIDKDQAAGTLCNLLINSRKSGSKLCLLLGGEPTVVVTGNGVGGRNQELALAAAMTLYDMNSPSLISILSGGTDGIDGPCDAAGAVVHAGIIEEALSQNISPADYISNNDSYHFFRQVSKGTYHLCPGHTGTNVCDIIVILID